ncbi:MAG: hypothetical protein ACRD6N_01725 [Pyrinomonadaceae bacterium]
MYQERERSHEGKSVFLGVAGLGQMVHQDAADSSDSRRPPLARGTELELELTQRFGSSNRLRDMIARMVLMACGAAFVFAGCASSGVFRGHYTHQFEVSRFERCGSRERWWVTGQVRPLIDASAGQSVYAELRGDLSGIGSYGHLGAYRREFVVREVIVVRPAADSDCR